MLAINKKLSPDVAALLEGRPAVEAAKIAKAVRLDVSQIPNEWRTRYMPVAQPQIDAKGKLFYTPAVVTRAENQLETLKFAWWDLSSRFADQDEAFEIATFRAGRCAVVDYAESIGKISLSTG